MTTTVGGQKAWASNTQATPMAGSCPGTDGNTVAPPAFWSRSGTGAAYDAATGEVTLSSTANGQLVSPIFPVSGSTSVAIRFEVYATTPSDYFTPQSGAHTGTDYFAADGTTLVQNTAGYTGNGDARAVALNQWVTYTSTSFATGPNVEKMRIRIFSSSTGTGSHWTSDARIRNVRVIVNR